MIGDLARDIGLGLPAFAGAGLMFAGTTGWRGMANLLRIPVGMMSLPRFRRQVRLLASIKDIIICSRDRRTGVGPAR
jgi:hypothetical protein